MALLKSAGFHSRMASLSNTRRRSTGFARRWTRPRLESLESRLCLAAELDFAFASGLSGSDFYDGIALDAQGNVYASTATTVNKYSPAFDLVWSANVRGANEIRLDSDGNLYATGTFSGSASFGTQAGPVVITSKGATDAFVVKLDPAGQTLWARSFGGTGSDRGAVITIDASDDVFVSGTFSQTATFGEQSLISSGFDDIFVSHLSKNGDIHWARRMGGASADNVYAMNSDLGGNAYFTGQYSLTSSFGSQTLTSSGASDAYVAKIDTSGVVTWARSVGGVSILELGTSLVVDPAGYVITAGEYSGSADFDPGPGVFTLSAQGSGSGGIDVFILKLDLDGQFVWAGALGGSSSASPAQMALGPEGSVYVTGSLSPIAGTATDMDPTGGSYLLTSAGNDAFVLAIDRDGKLISARSFGGSSLDTGVGIVADALGNAYVSGYFNARLAPGADFDPGPGTTLRTSVGTQDGFIVKLSPGTAAVGDLVWHDLNGNGLQDAGEPGLADTVVELWFSNDATQGNFDDSLVGSVITDGTGKYLFDQLPSGRYYLISHAPVGYGFTTPNAGGNDNSDSDILLTGRSAMFVLSPGQKDTSQDAGLGGASPDFGFGLRIGSTNADQANAVHTDAQGNVYVTGQFLGTVDFDPGPSVVNLTASATDVFVAKYTPSGALAWARRAGGTQIDRGIDLRTDGEGNVYVTGIFSSTADMDPGLPVVNLQASGGSDAFLLKLDSNGNFIWANRYSGTGGENLTSLDVDSAGNIYLGGNFFTSLTIRGSSPSTPLTVTSAGNFDGFVAKVSPSGDGIWMKAIGGVGEDAVNDVAVSGAGEVFLTGYFSGVADFDPGTGAGSVYTLSSAGGFDAFVSKLNVDGTLAWAERFGNAGSDRGSNGIAIDQAGNVYTSGDFQGTVNFDDSAPDATRTSAGPSDVFLSKRAPDGNLLWVRTAGGSQTDSGRAVTVDLSGDVYVTGNFQSTAAFAGGTVSNQLTSAGDSDVFVAKYDSAGGVLKTYRLGGSLIDNGTSIAVDSRFGNLFSAGQFRGAVDFDPGPSVFSLTGDGVGDAFVWQLHQNSRPRDVELSNDSVSENQTGPQAVGSLTVIDVNANDTFTFQLIDDADGRFYLSGNVLMANSALIDYEDETSHTITLVATDSGGLSIERSFVISVLETNDVPVVIISGSTSIDEANLFVGTGAFSDPDAEQWTALVDYGDGTGPTPLSLNADQTFSLSHVYADNGSYVITVSVTDSRGGAGQDSWSLEVVNIAPTASPNTYSTAQAVSVSGNLIADDTGSGSDSDPAGAYDPLTVDAVTMPSNGTLVWQANGAFTYTPDSTFTGQDAFSYTISDGDGGFDTATVIINVATAPGSSVTTIPDSCLGGSALLVTGTSGVDVILVGAGSTPSTIAVRVNGVLHEVARPSGRIIVLAGDGNDSVTIAGSISNPVWIYGGQGDDQLNASNGSSLLFGGDGNDQLLGGNGRDVMVGGDGADKLVSNGDQDILIAGYTSHDAPSSPGHEEFWCELTEQWNKEQEFSVRVQALRLYLADYLVDDHHDDELDQLNGAAGDDWLIFAVGEDRVVGQEEEVN
jgi:hypothetical protein